MQSAQRADKIPPARATVADAYRDFLEPGGMYPRASTLDGRLAHAAACKAAFGRRDWRCHRCLELLRGSKPRTADYAAASDSRQRRLF